jgi:hypothetical protein
MNIAALFQTAKNTLVSIFALFYCASLCQAEAISKNPASGAQHGFYYFLTASDNASEFSLEEPGRFTLKLDRSTVNISAGIGWQGSSPSIINYTGLYSRELASFATHLTFNVHATAADSAPAPKIELTIVESAGGYGLVCASSLQFEYYTDGARYNGRECTVAGTPADKKDRIWFIAARMPSNRYEQISGTITLENHVNAFRAKSANFAGIIDYVGLTFTSSNAKGLVDFTLSADSDYFFRDLSAPPTAITGSSSSSSSNSSSSSSSSSSSTTSSGASGKPVGATAGALDLLYCLTLLGLFSRGRRR